MYRYSIIGAGRQGAASAYDLVKFGNAENVILIDSNLNAAETAAEHVNKLTGKNLCTPIETDVKDRRKISELLKDVNAAVSAVPYYFNLDLTRIAIETETNFCDMGGNTGVVRDQLALSRQASEKGITVVPDCGMGPGMNISFAMHIYSQFDEADEIKIYVGGLPRNPKPPWNYQLLFHPNGLTNEYYGNAYCLREGRVTEIPCFAEIEQLEFPSPFGVLEAAVTSGGLSTSPWSLEGKVQTLEYKTLRYPGHWNQFKAYSQLGLFETEPVEISGQKIIPREFYHKLLEDKIGADFVDDVGIIKVIGKGKIDGRSAVPEIELIDYYDKNLNFTAMQKLTGWHASIVAILMAEGKLKPGAHSIENAVKGKSIVEEVRKRGIKLEEKIRFL